MCFTVIFWNGFCDLFARTHKGRKGGEETKRWTEQVKCMNSNCKTVKWSFLGGNPLVQLVFINLHLLPNQSAVNLVWALTFYHLTTKCSTTTIIHSMDASRIRALEDCKFVILESNVVIKMVKALVRHPHAAYSAAHAFALHHCSNVSTCPGINIEWMRCHREVNMRENCVDR